MPPSAKPVETADAEGTRDRLLQAAVTLFEETGYARTTLGEIAELASLSRPTVYRHFADKEAILWSLAEESHRMLDEAITEAAISESHVALDQLQQFIGDYVAIALNQRVMFRLVLRSSVELSSAHQDIFRDRQRRVLRFVENLLQAAIEQGACRKFVSVSVVAEAMLGMASSTVDWYRPGGALSAEQVANEIVDLIFDGLRP